MTRDEITTAEQAIADLYASMMGREPAEVAALVRDIEVITDRLDALPPGYFESPPASQQGAIVSQPVEQRRA